MKDSFSFQKILFVCLNLLFHDGSILNHLFHDGISQSSQKIHDGTKKVMDRRFQMLYGDSRVLILSGNVHTLRLGTDKIPIAILNLTKNVKYLAENRKKSQFSYIKNKIPFPVLSLKE